MLTNEQQALVDALPDDLKVGFDSALHQWVFLNNQCLGYKNKQVTTAQQVELSSVEVSSASARKVGGIWWMPENEAFTLTADVALPDSELMIMSERVVNGDTVVDDMRFIANIANGQVTINGTFKTSGNYQITAERLNSGLARIGMPIELIFNKIEFDVYV